MKLRSCAPVFAGLLSLLSHAVRADEAPTELEPVVVTATRSPQPVNRLPAAMTVIGRRDLELSGAQNLAEALRGVAGLQVVDFFGDGSQYATVDMRGFGVAAQANTAILVDGRRLNNVDIAPPDLSTIALKDVERIEIVQGSAGTLYGDQAVGGVINIVTREPESFSLDTGVGVGSYRGRQADVRIGQRAGSFSYRLTVGARGTDNYRAGNRHENENLLGRVGYDYDGGAAYLEGGYVNDRVQLPGPLTEAEMRQDPRQCEPLQCGNYSDSGTGFQRLNWRHGLGADWTFETDFTRRLSHASSQLTSFGARQRFTQKREQWSVNPRLEGRVPGPAGAMLITAGLDAQRAEYGLQSSIGAQADRQRQRDVYAQGIVPLTTSVEATLGARAARVDDRLYDGFTYTSSPRHETATAWQAGLAWAPAADWRLHARHDANFRFAKADEYFSFSSLFPPLAPDQVRLRPQTGHTYELGANWTGSPVTLHANLYVLELKNEISYDPSQFINVNLERTRRRGATLDVAWTVAPALQLSAAGQYLQARFASGPSAGKDVPLVARRTGRVAATAFLPRDASVSLEAVGVDRRFFDSDYANSEGRLAGYAVANLGVQQRWGRYRAGVRLNNLLDHAYSDYGALDALSGDPAYYPSPGRNFWFNVDASFN